MGWILGIGIIVVACLVFLGWACCKVGADADRRAGYDEHQDGLPL